MARTFESDAAIATRYGWPFTEIVVSPRRTGDVSPEIDTVSNLEAATLADSGWNGRLRPLRFGEVATLTPAGVKIWTNSSAGFKGISSCASSSNRSTPRLPNRWAT